MAEVVVAYSDCIDVQASHAGTKLLAYSNEFDLNGISFSLTERPIFYLRIPCKFFKERGVQEDEGEGLSDGEVVKLFGSVNEQKLLQVEPVPYFFHHIIRKALIHNYIVIEDERWEKTEAYSTTDLNEQFPFEKGEAWLTRKEDGYLFNVYGEV